LQALGKLIDYLLNSFTSALNYKRPYSQSNPWGLPIHVSTMEGPQTQKELFTNTTIMAGRLAAMGMLCLHYFVLEFTVLLAHMEDAEDPNKQLFSEEAEKEFNALMHSIHQYEADGLPNLQAKMGEDRPGLQGIGLAELINPIRDTDMLFSRDFDTLKRNWWNMQDNMALQFLRGMYYSIYCKGLSSYGEGFETEEYFKLTEERFYSFRSTAAAGTNGVTRIMEDGNVREELSHRFRQFSADPVYEYATTPSPASPETTSRIPDVVFSKVAGNVIQVQPRVRVHVWRRKLTWRSDDFKFLAAATGELGLMSDLLYVLPSVVACNHGFRNSTQYPVAELHSVYTRYFGGFDMLRGTYTTQRSEEMRAHVDALTQRRDQHSAIKDPLIPQAISIQPMPAALREWMEQVTNIDGHYASSCISNAVYRRSTNLNATDTLKLSNTQLSRQNVVWTSPDYGAEYESNYHISTKLHRNSMFVLHFGSALLHMNLPPFYGAVHVLGSNDLVLGETNYLTYHAAYSIFYDTSTIEYDTFKSMRGSIKTLQQQFLDTFSKRTAGFLHPASWLTQHELDLTGLDKWTKLNSFTDLTKGTVVDFSLLHGDAPDLSPEARTLNAETDNFKGSANQLSHGEPIRLPTEVPRGDPGQGFV